MYRSQSLPLPGGAATTVKSFPVILPVVNKNNIQKAKIGRLVIYQKNKERKKQEEENNVSVPSSNQSPPIMHSNGQIIVASSD